jgi:acyl-coenzyme A synthetase/AMP-(fatty) acid ligase
VKPRDMGVLFDECAERGTRTRVYLDRPFDIALGAKLDYSVGELAGLVREAAGWLAAAGAGPGDRVAIVKDNHWDYDLLACATVRIGAVPAQLSAHLSGESLETLLKRLEPAVLVTTTALVERCRREGIDLASLSRTVTLDGPAPGAVSVENLRGHEPSAPRRRGDDEPLVINHTSGTTGLPKLVVHTTATIIGKLARFESVRIPCIGVRRSDTVVNASAFAHGRTFCWTGSVLCLAPREIVIITGQDPDRADPMLRAHPPTVVEALPASLVRFQPLTERLDNPFRQVRMFVSTYDAMHPPTIRTYLHASRHRSPLWMQGWGQTETGPLTFRFHTRESVTKRQPTTRNLGRPVPIKTRLRVVDPQTFESLPRGRTGLVLTQTAAACVDYVGERDRWLAKWVGKWWNTGDIGVRNRDGSVQLLDREVDRTPELSCLHTEDLLEERLSRAIECLVLGCPGQPPLPVIVTPDGELDPRSWKHAVRDLPELQEPVVLTWHRIPRTGTGKVRRQTLFQQLTGRTDTHGSGRWT